MNHYHNIIQNSCTALKIRSTLLLHSPSSLTPGNHSSFYCHYSLAFPKCHIVGVIQFVTFLDWLFSLNNIYLRFLHTFPWLDNLLAMTVIIFYRCTKAYLSILLEEDILVVTKFGQLSMKQL